MSRRRSDRMATTELRCERHHTPTHVSCAQCDRPACSRCLVWTEVGQKCTTCVPVPKGDRRRPLVIGVVVVAAVAAAAAGSQMVGRSSGGGPAPSQSLVRHVAAIGEPVADGSITFVVDRFDCSATAVGDGALRQAAQGRYCVLGLRATNSGTRPALFSPRAQVLLDAQRRRYDPDPMATIVYQRTGGGPLPLPVQSLNPGAASTVAVVFDIPREVMPTEAELHAGQTLGVTVRLTGAR